MQRQLALNDEVDMEAIDGDSESSGCEQSSLGDSVAEVREIVRKQPKSSRCSGGIGSPRRNNEVRPEFKWPVLGSVETDSDWKDCCTVCWYQLFGDMDNVSDFSSPYQPELSRMISPLGQSN